MGIIEKFEVFDLVKLRHGNSSYIKEAAQKLYQV